MTTERERFEAWAIRILGDNPTWRGSGDCELAWQAWQAALSAPPGYVMVPVEPTPEMVAAYLAENDAYWIERDELVPPPGKWRTGTPAEATARSYSAMIAAAPKEPT